MEGFSILAGQLFLILCVQSVLEAMASKWQSGFMQKPIELGCYIASLAVVLRFMETYLLDILRALTHFLKVQIFIKYLTKVERMIIYFLYSARVTPMWLRWQSNDL
ncbi:MAG: hypothetical protein ACLUD9_00500 [Anaerotignum faecicola]